MEWDKMKPFDIEEARENLRKRREIAGQERERLFLKAEADCVAIVAMIRRQSNPKRIYQWGSLLHKEMFADYSDIDIALEGMGSIEDVMELEKGLKELTG